VSCSTAINSVGMLLSGFAALRIVLSSRLRDAGDEIVKLFPVKVRLCGFSPATLRGHADILDRVSISRGYTSPPPQDAGRHDRTHRAGRRRARDFRSSSSRFSRGKYEVSFTTTI